MKRILLLATVVIMFICAAQRVEANSIPAIQIDSLLKLDKDPTFLGQPMNDFERWVKARIIYPPKAQSKNIYGIVGLRFQIDTEGKLSNFIEILCADAMLTDEVIRVLKTAPRLIPGEVDGKAVVSTYTMRVAFKLNNYENTSPPLPKELLDKYLKKRDKPDGYSSLPNEVDGRKIYDIDSVDFVPQFGIISYFDLNKLISNRVKYPTIANSKGVTGIVSLACLISEDGKITINNLSPTVDESLVNAVVQELREFKNITPATKDGKAVPVWCVVEVVFRKE